MTGYFRVIKLYPESPEAKYANQQIKHLKLDPEQTARAKEAADEALAKEDRHYCPESNIVLTTAPWIEDYRVQDTIEIITAECVIGMNVVRDLFADFTDFFGGRSKTSQKVLREAKDTCC